MSVALRWNPRPRLNFADQRHGSTTLAGRRRQRTATDTVALPTLFGIWLGNSHGVSQSHVVSIRVGTTQQHTVGAAVLKIKHKLVEREFCPEA